MMINLLTVCTDAYPVEYARKTIKRFQQLTDYEVEPYCLTDRPNEVKKYATPLPYSPEISGWWNKIMLYAPTMPEGWNVYLDIDIVLIQNFDEEIQFAIDANKKMACVSDAINWKNNKFSSSMMVFKTGSMCDIYDRFITHHDKYQSFDGGDQVWTGQYLQDQDVLYLDEKFPNLKKNLKFHLGEKIFGQWNFPDYISKRVKMVDCGGRPKPHQITHLDYIKKNWVEV